MYLMIFEDGNFKLSDSFTDEDVESVDEGILSVINLQFETPLEWHGGRWVEIEHVKPL